jgi:hypothetical protein
MKAPRLDRVIRASQRPSTAKRGPVAGGPGRHSGGAPRVPFALLVTALIVGGMGLLLLLNTASAANEVRRHDLSARDASVAAQVQQLQNEVAASAAPGNLAQAAAALGMVPAANPAFIVVGADGSVTVMGSPAAASAVPVVQQSKAKKKKKVVKSTAAANKTATTTAHPTNTAAHSTKTGAKTTKPGTTSPAKKPPASPTPTPTPTLTLPGGNR